MVFGCCSGSEAARAWGNLMATITPWQRGAFDALEGKKLWENPYYDRKRWSAEMIQKLTREWEDGHAWMLARLETLRAEIRGK